MDYSYFILLFLIGFWGASIGSFTLCTAQRLAGGESLFKRSHCGSCEKPLTPLQLIPLFSYLFQRGKCAYCRNAVSPIYFYAELFLTLLTILGFWKWGISLDFIVYFIFLHFLGIIIFSDFLIQKIPMFASLGIGILGLLKISLMGTYNYMLSSVIAVSLVWVIHRTITKLKHQKALGDGDLFLIGACAFWVAPEELPSFAILVGSLGIILALLWYKKFKAARFPFAPAILLGMVLTKMISGETFTMHPINGPMLQHTQGTTPQGLVVIFHGYGASGNNLISLAQEWHQDFPTLDFIAPNGIEAWEGGIPGGYQWFSLVDRNLKRIEKSLDELRPTILSFLDAELGKRDLTYKNLILVGFSQGAMLALDLGLHGRRAPAGVIAYSGSYISTKDIDQKNVPILLIHGIEDSVLPPENSHTSHTLLKDAGVASQLHLLENLDHAIDHRGLRLGEDFIRKTLGSSQNPTT